MMNQKLKNLIIANVIVLFAVIGFVLLSKYVTDKEGYECSFYSLIHLYCPACGGTRALYALARLDIIASIRYNVTVPCGGFVYAYYNVRGFIAAIKNNTEYFAKQKYTLCIVLAVVLVLNFIIKNTLLLVWGIDIMPTT